MSVVRQQPQRLCGVGIDSRSTFLLLSEHRQGLRGGTFATSRRSKRKTLKLPGFVPHCMAMAPITDASVVDSSNDVCSGFGSPSCRQYSDLV